MIPNNWRLGGPIGYQCKRMDCPCRVGIVASGPGDRWGSRPKGLDDYVVKRVFEYYPTLKAMSYAANSEIDRLEDAVRIANADLVGVCR
jgi:hypothetical protein